MRTLAGLGSRVSVIQSEWISLLFVRVLSRGIEERDWKIWIGWSLFYGDVTWNDVGSMPRASGSLKTSRIAETSPIPSSQGEQCGDMAESHAVFRKFDLKANNTFLGRSQLLSQNMLRRITFRASSSTTCSSVRRLAQRLRTDGRETT